MKTIRIFKDISNQWRFRVFSNEQPIFTSRARRTKRKRNLDIDSVRKNSQIKERYFREIKNGKYYFDLKNRSGHTLGTSIPRKEVTAMEKDILSVMQNTKL